MEPNNDEVICPKCVHQFRAIPVNVQEELSRLRAENERMRADYRFISDTLLELQMVDDADTGKLICDILLKWKTENDRTKPKSDLTSVAIEQMGQRHVQKLLGIAPDNDGKEVGK